MTTPHDDQHQSRPFDMGGGDDGWGNWRNVMGGAIAPPLETIKDAIYQANLEDPFDAQLVAIYSDLTQEQLSDPSGHYQLELRLIYQQLRLIEEVLEETDELPDDEPMGLNPADWQEHAEVFYSLPLTRAQCLERRETAQERIRDLHGLIENARRKGVYYDICPLLDWLATPADERSSPSPEPHMPYFGKQLLALLAQSSAGIYWGNAQAVVSRQINPRQGGDYYENEKTRVRQYPQQPAQQQVPQQGGGMVL